MSSFERYRESCIFYIKIDFGILATLVTLFSLFKIEVPEIPKIMDQVIYFLVFILLILFLDLVFERWLLINSTQTVDNETPIKMKHARQALNIQTGIHILFIGSVVAYSYGRLEAHLQFQNQENTYTYIKGSISRYLDDENRLPKTIDDLSKRYPDVQDYLSTGRLVPFKYTIKDSSRYMITLPGLDDKVGTNDDWALDVVVVFRQK